MDKLRMTGAPATSVSNGTIRNDVNMIDAGVKNKAKSTEMNTGKGKRKRGRPPRIQGNNAPAQQLRQREMEDEEDVCFVCFDGGELVLCDRRGCPKAYHPACVKRDMSFFQSNTKWNCGWHICSSCQKASYYMCYTCPYSLCRRCTKNADYVCVRENKGLCGTCMRMIMLIENISVGNKEQVQVDFDDTTSWEYLFKVYWTSLKSKFSLTVDELTKSRNPWEGDELTKTRISWAGAGNKSRGRKTQNRVVPSSKDLQGTMWATKELMEFVAHVRNGDISILTYIDVEELLLDYIKRNNLLDPCHQCEIVCDQRLINLFGKARIDHFEMLRLLEDHFLLKENSLAHSTISGITDAVGSQAEMISRGNNNQLVWDEKRYKPHNRSDERRPEINCNLDAYASIDAAGSQAQSCSSGTATTIATVSTGDQLFATDTEADKVWCYRDPNGKIQGPFSLMLLRKWSTIGLFALDLRVWRVSEKEADSILLADALCGKLSKPQTSPCLSFFPQEVAVSSDYTNSKCDSGVSQTTKFTCINNKKGDSNWKLKQNDSSVHLSSNNESLRSNDCTIPASSTQPVDVSITRHEQAQSSLQVSELSKCTKSLADQQKICGSLPSSSSSLKPIDIPFLKVKDVHGNESRSACSPKSSEGQHNFRQCDERQGSSSSRCNSDSDYVSKSEQNHGADMSDVPVSVPKHSQADSKGHSIKTRHSDSPNAIVLDSGPSWSTASSLVIEKTHPEIEAKPLAEDWDSNVASASLTEPNDGFHNVAATTASGSGHMAHSSSLHPTIDTSSWQAIVPEQNEFCSLLGESVSDLLAQVEEMESLGSLPTPTSKLSCRKELMQGSENNCFSQAEGFSPVLDHGKDDSLRFSVDVVKPSQVNVSGERLQLSDMPASEPIVTAEPLELPQVSPQHPAANDQFQVSQVSSQPAVTVESLGISMAFDAKPSEALHNKWERDSDLRPPVLSAVSQGEASSNVRPPAPSSGCSSKVASPSSGRSSKVASPSSTLAGNQGTVKGILNFDIKAGQDDANASSENVHAVAQQHSSSNSNNRNQNSRGGHPRDRLSESTRDKFSEPRNHRNSFLRRDSSFGRDRSSRNRQPHFGSGNGGGSSRALPKGQRVCKFYERGCCKRGASCSYWHP